MVDSLGEYVLRMLQAGYTPESVRELLLQSGYDAASIDAAFASTGMNTSKGISIKPLTVAFGLGALLIIVLGVVIIAGVFAPKPIELSLSGKAEQATAAIGGTAGFSAKLENPSGRKADVQLNGELIEDATGTVIARKTQQLSLRESAAPLLRFTIPADANPGMYTITVTAQWDSKTATTKSSITLVTPEEAPILPPPPGAELSECPTGCDDLNKCTTDSCNAGQCVHEPLTPCCGNRACEADEDSINCVQDCRERTGSERPTYELREEAESTASDDPAKAEELCSQILSPAQADDCFAAIAPKTGVATCDKILDPNVKDACLIDFAAQDPSLCSSIQGSALRSSCYALARAKASMPAES